MANTKVSRLFFNGVDGSNPLGFLAAIGAFRSLSKMQPKASWRMGWAVTDGAWRPFVDSEKSDLEQKAICDSLSDWLEQPHQQGLLESDELGDNLTISPTSFRIISRRFLDAAEQGDEEAFSALEFLAAFGTDACHQSHSKDRSLMQDTALRTMSGAGHQHFIKFMRAVIENTNADHLRRTLFERWTYEDEGRGLNLRWDPIDDRRYAMRWKNPSADAAVSMRGANRLAIEALPLFATAPMGSDLQTTGFRSYRGTFWSWPIWTDAIDLDVLGSVLQISAISELQNRTSSTDLSRLGIATVYRSQRITVGKFRNFTPAIAVS